MILGIDIGTTGCKTILIAESGEKVSSAYQSYGMTVNKGRAEQNPAVWKDAIIRTVRKCLDDPDCPREAVTALALSTQSGTVIPLAGNGQALGPAVLWLDHSAKNQAERLLEDHPQQLFYQKTGWRLTGSFNFLQIVKYSEEEPKLFTQCDRFAHVADYLHEWLCGEPTVDLCGAGNSMLLNIRKRDWDDELLELCSITRSQLGHLAPTGAFLGTLQKETADLLGLPSTVKVFCGAQDQFCSALASRATRINDLVFSMGTSWVLMDVTDTARFNDANFAGVNNYPVDDLFCTYVYIPSGGKTLNWLRQTITGGNDTLLSYDDMTLEAGKVPPGSDNLMFINRLAGTLFPSWLAESTASFNGLNLSHGRGHVIRSVLEGVCFEYALMLEALQNMGGALSDEMIALGGSSRSPLWMSIAASTFNKSLKVFTEPDLAPIGAAFIAAKGDQIIGQYDETITWCPIEYKLTEPDPVLSEIYHERYQVYRELSLRR